MDNDNKDLGFRDFLSVSEMYRSGTLIMHLMLFLKGQFQDLKMV